MYWGNACKREWAALSCASVDGSHHSHYIRKRLQLAQGFNSVKKELIRHPLSELSKEPTCAGGKSG
jgi:hypothetical protein